MGTNFTAAGLKVGVSGKGHRMVPRHMKDH